MRARRCGQVETRCQAGLNKEETRIWAVGLVFATLVLGEHSQACPFNAMVSNEEVSGGGAGSYRMPPDKV